MNQENGIGQKSRANVTRVGIRIEVKNQRRPPSMADVWSKVQKRRIILAKKIKAMELTSTSLWHESKKLSKKWSCIWPKVKSQQENGMDSTSESKLINRRALFDMKAKNKQEGELHLT